MFQLKQLRKDGITYGTVFSKNDGQLYTDLLENIKYSMIKYLRSTLYIAIDIHCSFRSRFIVNQNFVFTFPFPFSLLFPGYCGLALRLQNQLLHLYNAISEFS